MKFLKCAAMAACLLGLAGCATAPVPTDFDNTRVYSKSKDEVWTSLVAFFATNNIQIKTIEKDSGVIYAERSSFDKVMADCGLDYLYVDVTNVASFNVLVIPRGAQTSVTVTSEFKAGRLGPYNATKVTQCLSTGYLEQQILDAI